MVRNRSIKVFVIVFQAFFLFFLATPANLSAQATISDPVVSCPEKWWAITHPCRAKKAYRITLQSLATTDSLRQSGNFTGPKASERLDAFKHGYWMVCLAATIGSRKAEKLGRAHEKGNYRAFKKGQRKGVSGYHDKASSEMDLWNNAIGIMIASENPGATAETVTEKVMEAIYAGRMRIIRKNEQGDYLNAQGLVIDPDGMQGAWDNGKVLVPSNL